MGEREKVIKHLIQDYSEPIRDPVWKNILLSPAMLKLIGLPAFQKLNGIMQLGPTYLVYPGATHTRLNHSLGVFHLGWRMIVHLLRNHDVPGFTLHGVKAFLCAALLHDLGHYPYAHSLKELDVESHEILTAKRIIEDDFSHLIENELGADIELVAAIIDSDIDYRGTEDIVLFRNLLSGVLDPDKLDYLNRDAYYCGVPYGIQDVDFILDEIRPYLNGIAVTWKGLTSLESILFSKYLMYRTVYWHKTVRVATAMIKKAILMGLTEGLIFPQYLYWLDDQEFYSLAGKYDYPPFRLILNVARRNLLKVFHSIAFCAENSIHREFENLKTRMQFEADLAGEIAKITGRTVEPQDIIIDIPERITFEIDLPVLDQDGKEYSPFDSRDVDRFNRTLRTVSLITARDNDILTALGKIGGRRILERGF